MICEKRRATVHIQLCIQLPLSAQWEYIILYLILSKYLITLWNAAPFNVIHCKCNMLCTVFVVLSMDCLGCLLYFLVFFFFLLWWCCCWTSQLINWTFLFSLSSVICYEFVKFVLKLRQVRPYVNKNNTGLLGVHDTEFYWYLILQLWQVADTNICTYTACPKKSPLGFN